MRCITALFLAALCGAGPVQAASFFVDSSADAPDASPGDGLCATVAGACTLRAAIQEANARPGPDVVEMPPGDFRLAIPGADEDGGATGDLDVTDDLLVRGSGREETVLDGGFLDRVLHVPRVLHPPFNQVALDIEGVTVTGGRGNGAAVFAPRGMLTVVDSTVAGNEEGPGFVYGAAVYGGDVYVLDSTLADNGGDAVTGFDLEVLDSTFEGNGGRGAFAVGGGHLDVEGSVFHDNGLGAEVDGSSPVIRDSVFSENDLPVSLISAYDPLVERVNVVDNFGPVLLFDAYVVEIRDSTIARNRSTGPEALPLSLSGGIQLEYGELEVTNTTISGNVGVEGGGIGAFVYYPKSLRISNSTITGNRAERGGGFFGGELVGLEDFTIQNSILAGNEAAIGSDCLTYSAYPDDPHYALLSGGHNLLGDGTGCDFTSAEGDQIGTAEAPIDPRLGPLADNGGPTPTHRLLPDSPALDAGSPDPPGSTDAACEAFDQRGVIRPVDGDGDSVARCDIGAFESEQPVDVEVKPERVNPLRRGVIKATLLGSAALDVAEVDVATLAFGPGAAPALHPRLLFPVDGNDDGFRDLVALYRTEETGIALGDTEACLSAELRDGTPLLGCAAIRTVPGCGAGFGLALLLPPLAALRRRRRPVPTPSARE